MDLPTDLKNRWKIVKNSLTYAVGGYFKAQFKIEVFIYIFLVSGLVILEVNYAPLIALRIAFLDFLPFFGTSIVLVPWSILKFLSNDYKFAIGLLLIWGIGQLGRQLIQPKFVGDSVGLPAIPTLFLLYIGYKFGSVVGMIVAVPIAIIVIDMNKAGFFDTTKTSVSIIVQGIHQYRIFTKEELEDSNFLIANDEKKGLV